MLPLCTQRTWTGGAGQRLNQGCGKNFVRDFPRTPFFWASLPFTGERPGKYGQRAYRYCQHDAGHAIGAVSIAAAGLGWQTRLLDDLGTDGLALLMGTFGEHDAEPEEPDVMMALGPFNEETNETGLPEDLVLSFESVHWRGPSQSTEYGAR